MHKQSKFYESYGMLSILFPKVEACHCSLLCDVNEGRRLLEKEYE